MDQLQVAEIWDDIGVLLELQGENPFKPRAYSNAARPPHGLDEPLEKLVAKKHLNTIKGIAQSKNGASPARDARKWPTALAVGRRLRMTIEVPQGRKKPP